MITTLSASGLRTFHECPARFRAQYVDGIWLDSDSPAFTFGKALHSGMEAHFKGKKFEDAFLKELSLHVLYPKDKEKDHAERDKMIRMGRAMFSEFIAVNGERWKPRLLEHKGQTVIRHPFRKEILPMQVKFVWDLVSMEEDIVDHKSSDQEYLMTDLTDDWQLMIYALAYFSLFGKPPRSVVFNVMTKRMKSKNQIIECFPDEMALAIAYEKLKWEMKKIRMGQFDGYCGYCDYCKLIGKPKKGRTWQRK